MNQSKKITVTGLVLMIMSTIFGFSNVGIAYDQMGYASIIWYLLGAVAFFIPTSLMFAEYGSSIRNDSGGVYSWLRYSIGEKWAFIGTFMWICVWTVNLVYNAPSMWISFSTMISGTDQTSHWHLFGLNSNQTIGIIGILATVILAYVATCGLNSIKRITAIGGTLGMAVFVIFFIMSLGTIALNHGHLAEPVKGIQTFLTSPNPQFQSPIAIISFMVYAIFAFGGIESISGVIDKLKNPQKTFPRGVLIASILMAIFYIGAILMCGFSINWQRIMGKSSVTLGNAMFVVMDNAGVVFGKAIGLSAAHAIGLGLLTARFTGLANFIAMIGLTVVLVYSPIKAFIIGSAKDLWPRKLIRINRHGMPATAMWFQVMVVVIILALISFSGSDIQRFYQILTDMNNVSTIFPYIFLVGAFPFFKKRKNLNHDLQLYKNHWVMLTVVVIVLLILGFSAAFNIIQPLLTGDYMTAFWTIIGPALFFILGVLLYHLAIKRRIQNQH